MDESGDFMVWIPHSLSGTIERAIYCTLFDIRRVSVLPSIDFLCTKPDIPAQPQPVSIGPPSLLGSWLPFSQSMTGDQLDAMRT
jgi:syntaxin-binding protein 5